MPNIAKRIGGKVTASNTNTASNKDKIRDIYELLPKLNCGLCGYGNCGRFAKAAAEGRASPLAADVIPGQVTR